MAIKSLRPAKESWSAVVWSCLVERVVHASSYSKSYSCLLQSCVGIKWSKVKSNSLGRIGVPEYALHGKSGVVQK